MKSKCIMIHKYINLYPSVPINKALDVLIDQLNNDKDDLMKKTKLCLTLFRMEGKKPPPPSTSFPPATSTNVGISP